MEQWRIIPGLSNYYEASDTGRIRSTDRFVNGFSAKANKPVMMKRSQTILSQNKRGAGYFYVCVCVDGAMRKEQVHKLVLMAFVGERPNGLQACHCDGNPSNNNIDNLRWDTPKNNQNDRVAHKTDKRGEDVGTAKFTEEIVKKIKNGMSFKDANKLYSISRTQFYRIKRGEAWPHIQA